MSTQTATKNPTKAVRRKAALLAHYDTCARLAIACGVAPEKANGKRIAVALLKLEREAHDSATAQCNGEAYNGQPFRPSWNEEGEESDSTPWEDYKRSVSERVALALGHSHKHPPAGFFFNSDARGYALKIDCDSPDGAALIWSCKLHTDWGGYGILSPEITGD